MGRSRRHAAHGTRRGLKLAGAVVLVAGIVTGATVTWTGQSQPSWSGPATALLAATSETRSPATAASSASSGPTAQAGERSAVPKRTTSRKNTSSQTTKRRAVGHGAPRPTRKPTSKVKAPTGPSAKPTAPSTTPTTPNTRPMPSTPTASRPPAGTSVDSLTGAQIFKAGPYHQTDTVPAQKAAELDRAGRTADAALVRQIASQPIAMWIGDWTSRDALAAHLTRSAARAASQGTTPVFVTYAIPGRDCGGYSTGGLDAASYLDWNRLIARQLAGSGAVVLVEPDSIALLGSPQCAAHEADRLSLLKQSVEILSSAGLVVYLDAGTSNWAPADEIAARLKKAGIESARGFFTNVSSFMATDREIAFADRVNALLGGGKHYVIDTSRNGATVTHWCNPPGAALGENPRVVSSGALDALLWVKPAGESDGTCNGGPAAGQWFERYALDLVRNRG